MANLMHKVNNAANIHFVKKGRTLSCPDDEVCTSFKGYLCYKTITSQNVSSEAQVKYFLFRRKVMFHSQDIQVFVFLTVP